MTTVLFTKRERERERRDDVEKQQQRSKSVVMAQCSMGDTGDHRVLAKTRASQRRTLLVLWTAVLLYLTKMRVLKYLGYDDDSVSSSASLRDRDRDDRDEDKDSSTVVISHERCSLNEREDDSDDAAGIFWTKKRKKKRKKERSIKGNNEEEEENRGRRCTCERGYGGYRCNEAKCENSCEHGVCQYGYCLCEDGWKGVKCDQPLCQFEDGCGINGECANPDYCKCNEKWFGVKCDKRCERGRFRFLEQRCDCESEKWVGDACEWATCEGDCTKHGECVMPDLCECKFGFSGEKCDVDDLSAALMMSKNRTTTTTTTTTTTEGEEYSGEEQIFGSNGGGPRGLVELLLLNQSVDLTTAALTLAKDVVEDENRWRNVQKWTSHVKDEKGEHALIKRSYILKQLSLPEVDELGMDRNENGEKMFKSCAIVGPSGTLQRSKPGDVIDSHFDQIFRIDLAPSNVRYKDSAGLRTTFRVLDRDTVETLIERKDLVDPKNPRTRKFKDTKLLIWRAESYELFPLLKTKFPEDDWDIMSPDIIAPFIEKYNEVKKSLLSSSLSTKTRLNAQQLKNLHHQSPPSALLTLAFAKRTCAYIQVWGFDFSSYSFRAQHGESFQYFSSPSFEPDENENSKRDLEYALLRNVAIASDDMDWCDFENSESCVSKAKTNLPEVSIEVGVAQVNEDENIK